MSTAVSELEAGWEDEFESCLPRVRCPKRGKHGEFIPIREFSIDNLDSPYKDESIVELVKIMAALTVRMQVKKVRSFFLECQKKIIRKISLASGRIYPPDRDDKGYGAPYVLHGTGYVQTVFIYREGIEENFFMDKTSTLCRCQECKESGSPRTSWGEVTIRTAGHVLDTFLVAEDEIKCYFDFDEDDTNPASVPSLIGNKDLVGTSNHTEDQLNLVFYTHDIEFAKKLRSLMFTFLAQQKKLVAKYHGGSDIVPIDRNFRHKAADLLDFSRVPGGDLLLQQLHQAIDDIEDKWNAVVQENCDTIPSSIQTDGNLVILVSHPHGCGKYVSLGQFTSRETIHYNENPDSLTMASYLYTTHTCPGSSGAPVFILSMERLGRVCPQIHSMFIRKSGLSRSGFSLEM